jgi:hypothetical protein
VVTAYDFLHDASSRGLEVTQLRLDTPEARDLQAQYAKLIQPLPQTVYEKCGALDTPLDNFGALAKLINKRSVEVVEPDRPSVYWRLVPARPGAARWDWEEQFVCFENGQEAPANFTSEEHDQYSKQWKPTCAGQANLLMVCNTDINRVSNDSGIARGDLRPKWNDMRFRHVCPCENTDNYMWIRSHSVISLESSELITRRLRSILCTASYGWCASSVARTGLLPAAARPALVPGLVAWRLLSRASSSLRRSCSSMSTRP